MKCEICDNEHMSEESEREYQCGDCGSSVEWVNNNWQWDVSKANVQSIPVLRRALRKIYMKAKDWKWDKYSVEEPDAQNLALEEIKDIAERALTR